MTRPITDKDQIKYLLRAFDEHVVMEAINDDDVWG